MTEQTSAVRLQTAPHPRAVLELLKPVTWFAAMWAFMCGVVSTGIPLLDRWPQLILGMILAGPMVCASSQAVNDWFDRHVDAINQPDRPIPSGRIAGRWGLWIAMIWSGLSLLLGAMLGIWALGATMIGVGLAWAYSAPPFRLKLNGWWGNAAVGFSYEGIAWFTGAAVILGDLPGPGIIFLAVAYSIGAHGIMTLNDFKALEGDRTMGVRSLPIQMGPDRAARFACFVMAMAQIAVIGFLLSLSRPMFAALIAGLLLAQLFLMRSLLRDPRGKAPWYNATGTTLYVFGMLAAALAIAPLSGGLNG